MTVSPAIEEEIRSRAAWLESFYPAVVGCRVCAGESRTGIDDAAGLSTFESSVSLPG